LACASERRDETPAWISCGAHDDGISKANQEPSRTGTHHLHKYLLHVLPRLGTRFYEQQPFLLGVRFGELPLRPARGGSEVELVTDEDDGDGRVGLAAQGLDPGFGLGE
jgi:hypothetical protein